VSCGTSPVAVVSDEAAHLVRLVAAPRHPLTPLHRILRI
jgi:hypothetical protein